MSYIRYPVPSHTPAGRSGVSVIVGALTVAPPAAGVRVGVAVQGSTNQGNFATAVPLVQPVVVPASRLLTVDVPEAVIETPTPGGAVAAGVSPVALVASAAGGAVGGGTEPGTAAGVGVGGAVVQGVEAVAVVTVTAGGAVVGGNAPATQEIKARVYRALEAHSYPDPAPVSQIIQALTAAVVETPTPGGAVVGGYAPTELIAGAIRLGVAVPGNTNQGFTTKEAKREEWPPVDLLSRGFVYYHAAPPIYRVIVPGNTNQGFIFKAAPAADVPAVGPSVLYARTSTAATTETPTPGGAVVSGNSPVAYVSVTPGGAVVGGNAPSAPLSETPTPGGATVGGTGPSAYVNVTAAGSTGGGTGATAYVNVTAGGATVGGNAPSAPLSETPAPGGATIGGNSPAPLTTVSTATSTGGGNPPTGSASSAAGGAVVGGNTPSPTIAVSVGGLAGGGTGASAVVIVGTGGAVVGGTGPGEPTLIRVTGHLNRGTPGGKTNPGTPSAGMYDRPGPRQTA